MHGVSASPLWIQISNDIEHKLKPIKGILKLSQNAWLIPADDNLPILAKFVELACSYSLSYSSLLIPDGVVNLALNVNKKIGP